MESKNPKKKRIRLTPAQIEEVAERIRALEAKPLPERIVDTCRSAVDALYDPLIEKLAANWSSHELAVVLTGEDIPIKGTTLERYIAEITAQRNEQAKSSKRSNRSKSSSSRSRKKEDSAASVSPPKPQSEPSLNGAGDLHSTPMELQEPESPPEFNSGYSPHPTEDGF